MKDAEAYREIERRVGGLPQELRDRLLFQLIAIISSGHSINTDNLLLSVLNVEIATKKLVN